MANMTIKLLQNIINPVKDGEGHRNELYCGMNNNCNNFNYSIYRHLDLCFGSLNLYNAHPFTAQPSVHSLCHLSIADDPVTDLHLCVLLTTELETLCPLHLLSTCPTQAVFVLYCQ